MEPVLLLTRPQEAADRVLRAVEARMGRAIPAVVSPLFAIVDLPFSLPAGVTPILTSEHGARRAGDQGVRGRAYCVGLRTADVARAHEMDPVTGPGDAEGLLDLIIRDAPPGPLLHIHGRHVTGDVAGSLRKAGLCADEVVAYEQVALPLSAPAHAVLGGAAPVIAPFFSTRTARLFAEALPQGVAAPLRAVAISEPAAAPLRAIGGLASITVAQRPDFNAMVAAICAGAIGSGSG